LALFWLAKDGKETGKAFEGTSKSELPESRELTNVTADDMAFNRAEMDGQ
jgi:hypothetical protein